MISVDINIITKKEFEKMKKKVFLIHFGFHKSPFGQCLIGLFRERVCHISFVNALDFLNLDILKSQWAGSVLVRDQKLILVTAKKIFQNEAEFKVLSKGTYFEAKVWKTLMNIPKGETVSYEDVAIMTGHGRAVRATANAVAKNYIAYLIPCHRVVKKNGSLHKYQWGSHIKNKILLSEKNYK